jgi:hypothetical protein
MEPTRPRAICRSGTRLIRTSRPSMMDIPVWVLALAIAVAGASNQDWARADREIRRLSPSVFPNLPMAVRAELGRRGCLIPQPFTARRPENVIRGHFTSPAQTDWAVLCSIAGVSSILVFRGGSVINVAELQRLPDRTFLQVVADNLAIGYSRAIGVANARLIRKYQKEFGGLVPSPLDHEGINDIFVEKGSSVWYWHRGQWLELQGAD